MKSQTPPRCLKEFALSCVLLTCTGLCAQVFQTPISGHIYGQLIIACTGSSNLYQSAATSTSIYARRENINDYYIKVWDAPATLHIVSFDVQHKSGTDFRLTLLQDANGNNFSVYSKVRAPAPDSVINGPVALPPPYTGNYTKIATGKRLHIFSFLNGGAAGNLIFSGNNGLTWQPDTIGIGYDNVWDVAIDTAGNAFIVGLSGIYKQSSNNSAWALVNTNSYSAKKILIDAQNRLLITNYGINTHLSLDNGVSFIGDSVGISGAVTKLGSDAQGNLYAFTGSLYKNTGGTGNWVNISAGFNSASHNNGAVNCISGDHTLTVGNTTGMYTSNDNGNTWQATNNGIFAEDIYSLITQPDGRLICTSDLGIFYKDAADTLWHPTTPITSFYPGNQLYNDPAGNIFVAVGPTFGSPYPLGKSTDNGLHFTVDSNGFSKIGGSGFYLDKTGTRYFYNYYATGTNPLTVWKSPLGSSTWSLDTTGMPVFPIYGTGVKDMRDDGQDYLYASIDLPGGDMMYRRPVAGIQWTPDTAGLGASLIISPLASNASLGIIAARGTELFRRTTTGWQNIPNLPEPSGNSSAGITALAIDNHAFIYLAFANYATPDSSAVFVSKDTGATWQPAGLTGTTISALTATGDTAYALTRGNWGYVINNTYTNVAPTNGTTNDLRVYPNPSTQVWNIQCSSCKDADFDILDVTGRLVYHGLIYDANTSLNAAPFAPGIYLLHVKQGDQILSTWLVK